MPVTITLRRIAAALASSLLSACAYDTVAPIDVGDTVRYDLLFESTLEGNLNGLQLRVLRSDDRGMAPLFGQVVHGASPSVSADGQRVAYIGPNTSTNGYDYQDLWVFTRGSTPRRLALSYGPEVSPALSPDGSRIAFVKLDDDGNATLYVVDADGRNERPVSPALPPGVRWVFSSPAWSPNGQRLLFSAGQPGNLRLFIADADGRRLEQVTETNVSDIDGTWSPDGRTIAFVRTSSPSQSQLMVLHLDTGAERAFGFAWRNRHPAWSPDGSRIAFVSNMTDNADLELYTVRPDGTGLTRLTDDDLRQQRPAWLRR